MSDIIKKKPSAKELLAQYQSKHPIGNRLIVAVDSTTGQEAPTWDTIYKLQAKLFGGATAQPEVQLVYFNEGNCLASDWSSSEKFASPSTPVECQCPNRCTQVGRVLEHTLHENEKQHVDALVLIGSYVDEPMKILSPMAESLGSQGVPIFVFHEEDISGSNQSFERLAFASGGTYTKEKIAVAATGDASAIGYNKGRTK